MKVLSTQNVLSAIRESMDIEEEYDFFDDDRLEGLLLDIDVAEFDDEYEDSVEFIC